VSPLRLRLVPVQPVPPSLVLRALRHYRLERAADRDLTEAIGSASTVVEDADGHGEEAEVQGGGAEDAGGADSYDNSSCGDASAACAVGSACAASAASHQAYNTAASDSAISWTALAVGGKRAAAGAGGVP